MPKPIEVPNDYKTDFDKQLESSGLIIDNRDSNLLLGTDQSELGDQFSGIDIQDYQGTVPNVSLPFKTDSENKAYLDKTYREIKANQQSTMGQIFNATVGGAAAGLLGGIENIALIPQSFTDDFEKNPVAQIFADMKQFVNESTPIYTHTDVKGLSDIDETADVWQGIKSIVDSAASFGVPGGAIVKGTSYLSRLGRMLKPTRLGKALSARNISNPIYNKANAFLAKAQNSPAFQQMAQAGFTGVISNQLEGTVMAIELYDQVVKDLTSQGIEETRARKIAQERANEMEEMNRSMLLTNVFQMYGLNKALAGTRNIMTAPGIMNNIKSSFSFKTPFNNIFLQNLVEAGEEMYQSSIQQSLETLAKKDAGLIETNKNKYQLIGDYLFSDQALYEGTLGFFGGALQRAISSVGSFSDKPELQKRYESQQNSMKEASSLMASNIKDFAKAEMIRQKALQENDSDFEKLVGDVQFLNLATTAFEMGTTGHLEGILDDLSRSEVEEEANSARVLKEKLLNWEDKYIQVANQPGDTRQQFMRTIANDIYHEQLGALENRRQDLLSDYKKQTLNLAKNKKVVVDQFGIIKEDSLDKHISIDEDGKINFSEFIKTENATSIKGMEEFVRTQNTLGQDLDKTLEEIDLLNNTIELNTEALEYSKSPERLEEVAKQEQATEIINKAKEEVTVENVRTIEDQLIEDLGDTDITPEQMVSVNELFDELKEERTNILTTEVNNQEVESPKIEVDENTTMENLGDGTRLVESNGEATVDKVVTPKEVITDEQFNQFVDEGKVNPDIIRNIADKIKRGKPLSTREQAIFSDNIDKVEYHLQGQATIPAIKTIQQTRDNLSKDKKQQPTVQELEKHTKDYNVEAEIVDIGNDKIAYAASEFETKIAQGKLTRKDILTDGKITLNPEYIYTIHPDKVLPEEEITLRPVANPDDVMVYQDGEKVTYKEWKNNNPELDPSLKLPIEIISNNQVIGYVHDTEWINKDNVQGKTVSIEDQKARLAKVRKAVLDKGQINTIIKSKTFGKLLTTTIDTLANNTPNSVVALYVDDAFTNSSDKTPIDNIEIIGDQIFDTGVTYNLLRVQDKKYLATPVRHSKMSNQLSTTVVQAISSYVTGEDTDAVKAIAKETGYNILEAGGLSNYIKLFFPVKNTRGYNIKLDSILTDTYQFLNDSDYNTSITGRPFILVEQGNVIFGREGARAESFSYVTKGSNTSLLEGFEQQLAHGFINLSIEGFGKKPVLIDADGQPSTVYNTYEEYAKDNITTNIYGIDIGDATIYTTQPVIRYYDDFVDNIKEKKPTEDKIEGITDEQQDLLDDLDDFELDNEELFDFSPRELTEEEVDTLKDRINNLDKTFEGLTYLQANQVISAMINHVSSKALEGAVNLEDTLSEYGQILATNLEKYKKIPLDKISERKAKVVQVLINNYEATLANFEALAEIAVADLNNDDKFKLDLEEVVDEKGDVYDIALYEINPKSGVTSTLKRVLGGFTRDKKNFLAMQEFIPFDEAFNTIAAILADTQHNIDSVIKHLQDNLEARPWLKQAIQRIENLDPQLQNQFLSRMIMSKLNMKYVALRQDGNRVRLDVINTNRNDIGTAIQNNWRQNIKTAGLFQPNQGSYSPIASRVEELKQLEPSLDNLDEILRAFGINLSRKTLESIDKYGLGGKPLPKVFSERDGLVKILLREVNTMVRDNLTLADTNPINQGMISRLAYTESRFNKQAYLTPNTFRTEEKQIYGYTQHTMISDRVKGLLDGTKINQLKESSFTKHSFYLSLLDPMNKSKQAESFRERFTVFDSDLKAFETNLIGNSQKAGNFTSLAEAEHELARIAYFHNSNSKVSNGYRAARFVFPTMSDKSRVLVMEGLSEDLVGKDAAKVVFDKVVYPEIERAITHEDKNIKAYNTGAKIINFLPELNAVELTDQKVTLVEFMNEHKELAQTAQGKALMEEKLTPIIREYINSEVERKTAKWKALDLEKYIPNREGFVKEFVVNNMLNISEMYQLFIGDPAMFYKSKVLKDVSKYHTLDKKSQIKIASDTFTNVNKRLAMLIAPGVKLADNENNKYHQVMLQDRESGSIAYDYLKAFMGEENAREYSDGRIEGTDAQEFVTWQEHLYVMEKLGEIEPFTDVEGKEITQEQIEEARKIFEKGTKLEDLNSSQVDLINNLMQVMKPVYTGQVNKDGVQQVVYVKSSAFPLIPQLTQGLEIDKLRLAMEEMQESTLNTQNGINGTVRASFGTANKVGAIANSINIWNEDGTIRDITGQELKDSSIQLTRDNFRIQMTVPFKSGKKSKQDQVNIGTQERKLLFANLMHLDGFKFKGKEYKATELYQEYNNLYDRLFKLNLDKLYDELNIDPTFNVPIANQVDIQLLADMLQKEATERNYPLGDIRGLELKDGKFNIPLWLHQSSDRYESLLNSIVSNRIIGLKMPGYSYVLGTEEGFKDKKILEFDQLDDTFKSKIVFTDSWEGELKPARFVLKETGETITQSIDSYKKDEIEFRSSQVIAPMKFRDSKGNLLNLMEKDKAGNYIYIEDTPRGFRLNPSKFNKETLKLFGFRIPTSGLMSMASIEIVGFTPLNSGDVLIATRDFTKQMGSDFDVDKITGYMSNTMLENGKLVIDNSTEEKQLQNDIIELHHSVLSHQSDYVQEQIHRPLSFDFAADVAEIIDTKRQGESNVMFTPLSTEYQKELMMSGVSGKSGTGVYSLDVVFHANAQALLAQGTPIELIDESGLPYNLTIAGVTGHRELGNDETVKPSRVAIARNFLLAKDNLTNEESRLVDLLSQSNPEGAVTLFEEIHPGVIDTELAEFRYISDVLSEAQNYSVDNAKEAIMGRINDNSVTFNARKVFNELGIDKTHSKINTDSGLVRSSVPNLFMTQTVLMDELVPRVLSKQSSLAPYDPNVLGTVKDEITKLLQEAGSNYNSKDKNDIIASITPQEMFDMIGMSFEEMSPLQLTQQSAILDKFIELDMIGSQINSIQTSINTDSKKLGKSLFDNIATIEKVIKLDSKIVTIDDEKYLFKNAEKLIGDYSNEAKEGYRKVTNGLYIKPETVNGFATIHGLVTALDLYKEVFPYTDTRFNSIAKELGDVLGKEETTTRLRQDLLKTLKSFVYSQASIQNLNKSTNETRAELFIDTEENMSLARYIESSLSTNPKLRKYAIMNSINLRVESNGQPSVILWNNSAQNEFQDQFYMSFLGMLQDESSLPDYNGNTMTVQSLAQNMITYAFLEGGIQQATQYIRHIPVEYLDAFGISENLREIDLSRPSTYGLNTSKMKDSGYVPDIIRQYVQHNPRKVEQVEGTGDYLNPSVSNLNSKFVSIFTPDNVVKGVRNSGINLYELMTGSQGVGYYKIPVLGVSNFNEYNIDARGTIQESLVHKEIPVEKAKQSTKGSIPVETKTEVKKSYQINTNESKNILKQINNPLAQVYSEVDKQFKVRTIAGYRFEGAYKDGVIYLSEGFIKEVAEGKKTKEYFERVFLEEYTHALTRDALKNPTKNQKKIVDQITRYYNRAKKAIEQKFGMERLSELEERFKDPRSPKGLTKEERAYIYGGINIVEFVGHIMTNSEFQEMLNDVTFQKEGRPESFWNKIKELMTKLIANIVNLPNLKENSLTTLAISDILDLIGQGKVDIVNNAKPQVQNELVSSKTITPIDKSERQYKLPDGRVITFNMQQWEGLQKMERFLKDPKENVFVLSGYAGTGKTTIVKKILDSYRGNVAVSAPTHKAKKVIAQTTGKESFTIQSLLGLRPNVDLDNFNPNNPQFKRLGEAQIAFKDLIVLDEASMINKNLYKMLVEEAKNAGTKILFMGDPAQIPPVGENRSLVFDNISHQLTQVERTTSGNPLLLIFDNIRANIRSKFDNFAHTTKLNDQGQGVEFTKNLKEVKDKVIKWFKSPQFKENSNYAKVIAYTNDSVQEWNNLIRRQLTDSNDIVVEGDLLMAYDTVSLNKYENLIENSQDYKIVSVKDGSKYVGNTKVKGYWATLDTNNEIFIIDHNDKPSFDTYKEEYYKRLQAGKSYRAWSDYYAFKRDILSMKAFSYKGESFPKTLDYGYAVTAHKSQGSTYNKVAIMENDIDGNRKTQERNQIKYVAFSRAKENVISYTNKAGEDIQRETIEDEFIEDDVVEDVNLEEMISIKDLDLSPFSVSDFRQSLNDEDRKLFNRLKRQGVIKTKCK